MSIKISWKTDKAESLASFDDCELIIFDKDGTLIDFNSVWLNMAAARAQWLADKLSSNSPELFTWRNRFLRAAGIDPESGKISLSAPIVNLSFENQSYCLATLLYTLLPDKYSLDQSLKLTTEAIAWALHHNDPAEMAMALPGAFEFIREISQSGIKLAMITSDSTDNAERTLRRFGVFNYFSVIRGGDIMPAKPSPLAALQVCKEMGVNPKKAILIGDAPNDIRMAKEAGIKVICLEGLANPAELLALGADAILPAWSDLSFEFCEKKVVPTNNLILRTDGASRGNPGEAAIGFVIVEAETGRQIDGLGKPIGKYTNNYAEYLALVEGLQRVAEFAPLKLDIEMDSDLIVKQVQGKYKVKEPSLIELHSKVISLLKTLKSTTWTIKHIPRKLNSAADKLCNLALDGGKEVNIS